MSVPTSLVSIAVEQVVGGPLPRARVRFELTAPDVAAGALVAPRAASVTVGDDGLGSVALFSNAQGTQGTQYRVTIHSQTGDLMFSGLATVPASACNLHEILSLVPPASVDDAQAAALAAQGYAAAAGAIAGKATDSALRAWAYAQAFAVVSCTRNSDGAITTASIVWPDGTAGVYTADALSASFPGATDAWHATYAGTPAKTITQAAVTRNSDGAVTAQPAVTIV